MACQISMTDDQLIEKFLSGDIQAFNTLVWKWEKNLYNFVLRYIGNREDAKDICQKTFIRVYRKVNKLRDTTKFSTWLYQIAVNICRDELKRRGRRDYVSLDEIVDRGNGLLATAMDSQSDPVEHPEMLTDQRDLRELINRVLQSIPEEQRIVIIMKEYQGLKFTEIAEVLETSVNTTKSRMYYGLTAMRKILKKWKISEEILGYEV